MATICNVNGRICGEQDATISVLDHGFLYGEGVYEVCRTYNGQPFLFDRHCRRMRRSAERLTLPVPFSDAELAARVDQTLEAAGLSAAAAPAAYVRLLLTRGVGELTYDPDACARPTLVIIAKPLVAPPGDVYESGVKVSLVSVTRNLPTALDPAIKSNNLLNNVLAMQEAIRHQAFEAVMHNHRGELAECSQSNLFVVKNGMVLTPPLDAGLLAGITREFLFEIARDLGIRMEERVLRDPDLLSADEAFLSSTTREVVPIVAAGAEPIGGGRPGAITRALLAAYRQRADELTRAGAQTPAFSA